MFFICLIHLIFGCPNAYIYDSNEMNTNTKSLTIMPSYTSEIKKNVQNTEGVSVLQPFYFQLITLYF